MSRLAVIGTFFGRHENTFPLFHRVLVSSTRPPAEFWVMCETEEDYEVADRAALDMDDLELYVSSDVFIVHCPTPTTDGKYDVIPYSNKINEALDATEADLIVYLDNGSLPSPYKYEVMAGGLEEHPEWGAVYCSQLRSGYENLVSVADEVVQDAYCRLNYTQVMHRRTDDRWPLDMALASPDLADAFFWRSLHSSLGSFHPVGGDEVLDQHHMPSPTAAGVT